MNLKTLQILLVLVVVVFAIGLALVLAPDRVRIDPENFEPPAWLETFGGLAGGPRLEARDLTRAGAAFPANLRLAAGQTAEYAVSGSEERVRRVTFTIVQGSRIDVEIRYQPASGQRVGGEEAETQDWRNREDDSDTASFVVYDRGGTFRFRNTSTQPVDVRMED